MAISGNKLLAMALSEFRKRLPAEWKAEFEDTANGSSGIDAYLRLTAPDRRTALLPVVIKRRLEPRGVVELAHRLNDVAGGEAHLVIAPYLSSAVRERLGEAGWAFMDLTGNICLKLKDPGLYIETQGADVDPDRKARPTRSLRGGKAGRIVRLLTDLKEPPGVRELAGLAGIDPGYVSRVLSLLHREALIERHGRGGIVKVDWPRLLRRWSEDAPLSSRGIQTTCLEPRGLTVLSSRLKEFDLRYAITGTLAAAKFAPIAPPRLATIYVEDTAQIISGLGLRVANSGANILLIEPDHDYAFIGAAKQDDLIFAALSQIAADLLTSPGRGPAEAEELIKWMGENEEVWRG